MQVGEEDVVECGFAGCTIEDLLPARCGKCRRSYCSQHLPYAAHDCASHRDATVLRCPLCGRLLQREQGVNENVTVTRHIDRGCFDEARPPGPGGGAQPGAAAAAVGRAHRCALDGCGGREPVAFVCDRCGSNFCVKHRMPTQHRCAVRTPPPQPSPPRQPQQQQASPVLPAMATRNTAETAYGVAAGPGTLVLSVQFERANGAAPFFLRVPRLAPVASVVERALREAMVPPPSAAAPLHLHHVRGQMLLPPELPIGDACGDLEPVVVSPESRLNGHR